MRRPEYIRQGPIRYAGNKVEAQASTLFPWYNAKPPHQTTWSTNRALTSVWSGGAVNETGSKMGCARRWPGHQCPQSQVRSGHNFQICGGRQISTFRSVIACAPFSCFRFVQIGDGRKVDGGLNYLNLSDSAECRSESKTLGFFQIWTVVFQGPGIVLSISARFRFRGDCSLESEITQSMLEPGVYIDISILLVYSGVSIIIQFLL